MNPGSYAEPKFPPTDEYSQSNYIPPHSAEYYRHSYQPQALTTNYGYNIPETRRYPEDKFTPTHYNSCNSSDSVSPTHSSPPHTTPGSGGPGGGTGLTAYSQPPAPTPSPPVDNSSDDEGSPGSQTSCTVQQDADGHPIIYPWMKKNQGNNPGMSS